MSAPFSTITALSSLEAEISQKVRSLVEENQKLRSLLLRGVSAVSDGFVGGEWAALVPETVPLAAAKELDEATEWLSDARAKLGDK